MQIQELYLKNFGKFSEKKILLREGINILYGENEFGKTTLHAFIRGMLFGMERGRGRASKNGAFAIYEPWVNPNYYAGVLRFTCDGKHFCIERNFDKYARKASLICEDDGEILSIEHGDLEMLLGGLTAANYDNTVAVGQLGIETGRDLVSELKNYATNYYGTGNSEIQLWQAVDALKVKTKNMESDMKDSMMKKRDRIEKIEQESGYVWRDIQKNTEEISRLNQEIELQKAALFKIDNKPDRRNSNGTESRSDKSQPTVRRAKRWRIHPGAYILMILVIIAPFIVLQRPWNYLWALVLALAEGLFVWHRLKEGKRTLAREVSDEHKAVDNLVDEIDKLKQMVAKLDWKKELLQEELKEKQIMYSNLQENLQELDEVTDEYKKLEKHRLAIQLAMDNIVGISKVINKEFGVVLDQKASAILDAITDGKYSKLFIDDELNMSLLKGANRIRVEQVSRGTVEQIYFSLRMAAAEMLYQEELPVVLDETFAFYDEKRLQNALRWIYENKKQVIIFTCQKRENELLEKMGII